MNNCNHDELKTPYCPKCGIVKPSDKNALLTLLREEMYKRQQNYGNHSGMGYANSPASIEHRRLLREKEEAQSWIALVEKYLP